jgi:hypothetical protein
MKKIINKKIITYFIVFTIIIAIYILLMIFKKYIYTKKEYFDNNSKIYIICDKDHFKIFEDYVNSFINKLNNHKLILFDKNKLDDIPSNYNDKDKFIFIFYIPPTLLNKFNENSKNIYLINTEQLSRPNEADKINNYPKFIKMIDYSKGNFKYYTNKFTPKLLEYQINDDELLNLEKTNDICIIDGLSDYRKKIVDQLREKNIKVDVINGWKKERDIKLFSYKIILNISYNNEYKIMEGIRCNRCVYNKMIVISDNKEDMDSYSLKNYVIFVDYDKLVDKVIEVYKNYNSYYKKLGLNTLDISKLEINSDTINSLNNE